MENKKNKVEKKELPKEETDKIKKDMNEAIDRANVEELIRVNVSEFEYEKVKYRVSRPTGAQRKELYSKRAEKHIQLLTEGTFKPEEILKKLYLKQNIDIDDIDKKINALNNQKNDYSMKLGKALEDKAQDKELSIYKKEIEKIVDIQKELSIKKTNYLEYSLENQVNMFTYSYCSFLVTDKEVKGDKEGETKWVKAFDTFEDFQNANNNLLNMITFRASILLMPQEILV